MPTRAPKTIIVLNEDLPGGEFLAMVVTCTVGLGLIVHGVSANPLAGWIARRESTERSEARE